MKTIIVPVDDLIDQFNKNNSIDKNFEEDIKHYFLIDFDYYYKKIKHKNKNEQRILDRTVCYINYTTYIKNLSAAAEDIEPVDDDNYLAPEEYVPDYAEKMILSSIGKQYKLNSDCFFSSGSVRRHSEDNPCYKTARLMSFRKALKVEKFNDTDFVNLKEFRFLSDETILRKLKNKLWFAYANAEGIGKK